MLSYVIMSCYVVLCCVVLLCCCVVVLCSVMLCYALTRIKELVSKEKRLDLLRTYFLGN